MKKYFALVAALVGVVSASAAEAGGMGLPARVSALDVTDWVAVPGSSIWTEDMFTVIDVDIISWEVDVQQSASHPGLYRVMNPYNNGKCPLEIADLEPDKEVGDIYINAENPDYVYIEPSPIRLAVTDPQYEYTTFNSEVSLMLNDKSHDYTIEDLIAMGIPAGRLVEGRITFPTGSLCLTFDGKRIPSNLSGKTRLDLPGAKDYDIAINGNQCWSESTGNFSITCAGDVAGVRFGIVEGAYVFGTADYIRLFDSLTPLAEGATEAVGKDVANGFATAVVASCAPDGSFRQGDSMIFMVYEDDADDWEELEGNGQYKDAIVSLGYSSLLVSEYPVVVEQSKTSRRVRVKNPYGSAWRYYDSEQQLPGDHYLIFNLENLDSIVVEASMLGIDLGYGAMGAISLPEYYRTQNPGADPSVYADAYGSYSKVKRSISMPKLSMYLLECVGGFYLCNQDNQSSPLKRKARTTLTLPESFDDFGGVGDALIDGGQARAEYFNLQGVRVDNPSNGVYIKRVNGKPEKVFVD